MLFFEAIKLTFGIGEMPCFDYYKRLFFTSYRRKILMIKVGHCIHAFFNKGHPIGDSTEKILRNKGQYTMSSTELNQNKGQQKCLLFFQITYFNNSFGQPCVGDWPGFEPLTNWTVVRRANHWVFMWPRHYILHTSKIYILGYMSVSVSWIKPFVLE